uniref:Uncharacterized protein n=1 Tax=Glossina pallidipes TaxID=7398 RepID=A0A1B0AB93_GLOPL
MPQIVYFLLERLSNEVIFLLDKFKKFLLDFKGCLDDIRRLLEVKMNVHKMDAGEKIKKGVQNSSL